MFGGFFSSSFSTQSSGAEVSCHRPPACPPFPSLPLTQSSREFEKYLETPSSFFPPEMLV